MPVTQPDTKGTTKEMGAALTAARNNLSLLEAESARFEKIITAQKREVIVHEGTLKDYEKRINHAETLTIALGKEVVSSQKSLDAVLEILAERQTFLSKLGFEIGVKETALNQREAELMKKETSYVQEAHDLAKAKEALEKDRATFDEKVHRLKALFNEHDF